MTGKPWQINPYLRIGYDSEGQPRVLANTYRLTKGQIQANVEGCIDKHTGAADIQAWLDAWMGTRPPAPPAPPRPPDPPRAFAFPTLPPDALYALGRSRCHGARLVLMLSRSRGFVSANCSTCGQPTHVRVGDLPPQRCICGIEMTVRYLDGKNYFYVCESCGENWMLAARLPPYYKYFSYHPLPAGPFH